MKVDGIAKLTAKFTAPVAYEHEHEHRFAEHEFEEREEPESRRVLLR